MNTRGATTAGPTDFSPEVRTFIDPWDALEDDVEHRETWLLSYIDILTLFLTLFVVLLVLQPNDESPPIEADPGEFRQFSLQQIEHRSLPHSAVTRVAPEQSTGGDAIDQELLVIKDSVNGILATENSADIAPLTDIATSQSDLPITELSVADLQDPGVSPARNELAIDTPIAVRQRTVAWSPTDLPIFNTLFTEYLDTDVPLPAGLMTAEPPVAAHQGVSVSSLLELTTIDTPVVEGPDTDEFSERSKSVDAGSFASSEESESVNPSQSKVDLVPTHKQQSNDLMSRFLTELEQADLDKKVKVSLLAEGVYLEVQDNVLFAVGSADLKAEGAKLLNELASIFQSHRGIVSVEGHTDNQPISTAQFPSNWELSTGRATTVTRYLVGKGLNAARLRAVGYADTRPLESNATAAGRSRNRRVALIVNLHED